MLAASATHLDGNIVAGGFLKAFEWLRAHSWDFDSATDMITYLDDLTESTEVEACTAMPQPGSSVRIMNLHKVKGLEAPVVFLAERVRQFHPRVPTTISIAVPNSHVVTWGLIGKPGEFKRTPVAHPSDWKLHQEEEVRFLLEERKRLLYVACTRAGSQLVISKQGDDRKSFWKDLDPFLGEATPLTVPAPSSAEDVADNEGTPWPTLPECQVAIAARWQNSCSPSYGLVALKETAMKESKRPTWQASGQYGANWGSAIHQLLEIRTKTPDANLQRMAAQLAEEFELGSARVEEMLATVESVLASDIWQRAQRSQAVYSEVPIDSSADVDGVPTITRGVIDPDLQGTRWLGNRRLQGRMISRSSMSMRPQSTIAPSSSGMRKPGKKPPGSQ